MSDNSDKRKKAVPIRKGLPNAEDILDRLERLEERLSAFETACPPDFRKLAADTVEKILKMSPAASFEVLKAYKHGSLRLGAGQVIRADMYARLMDHVHNGLLLGRVIEGETVLEKYRAEAEARHAVAEAARRETRELALLESMKAAAGPQEPVAPAPEPEPDPAPPAEDGSPSE